MAQVEVVEEEEEDEAVLLLNVYLSSQARDALLMNKKLCSKSFQQFRSYHWLL